MTSDSNRVPCSALSSWNTKDEVLDSSSGWQDWSSREEVIRHPNPEIQHVWRARTYDRSEFRLYSTVPPKDLTDNLRAKKRRHWARATG